MYRENDISRGPGPMVYQQLRSEYLYIYIFFRISTITILFRKILNNTEKMGELKPRSFIFFTPYRREQDRVKVLDHVYASTHGLAITFLWSCVRKFSRYKLNKTYCEVLYTSFNNSLKLVWTHTRSRTRFADRPSFIIEKVHRSSF